MASPSINDRLNALENRVINFENQVKNLNASYAQQDKNLSKIKDNLAEEKKEIEKLSRNRTLKEFFICCFKHLKNMWNGVPTPENERVWTQLSLLKCAIGLLAVLTVISIVADRFFPVQSTSPLFAWQRV